MNAPALVLLCSPLLSPAQSTLIVSLSSIIHLLLRVVWCLVVSCRVVCCLVCMCARVWLSQVLCYVAGREQRACRQFWRAGCLYISSARDTAFNDACTNRSGCTLDVAGRGWWCARVCLLLEDASRLDREEVLPPAQDGHACSTEQWQQ